MKLLGRIALVVVLLIALLWIGLLALSRGWLGGPEHRGEVSSGPVPASEVVGRATLQRTAGAPPDKQIVFGDLHVHTTFSFDAFLMSLPIAGGSGAHSPADACDFARYCSSLDFWSINDHAENITPRLWRETIESVRQCNDAAGDPANPDLVSYLGWEWSQIGLTPESHYGHKNVVLLGTDDAEIPTRPIGSVPRIAGRRGLVPPVGMALLALVNGERGRNFTNLMSEVRGTPRCAEGVPVRELPADCMERAATPEELFAKLNDWDLPTIVIPHGTAWGLYTPPGSSWRQQLAGDDPDLQTMLEVYSGHGNSEVYKNWSAVVSDTDGAWLCPEPSADYLPSCWRAGELVEAGCLEAGADAAECERRAAEARQNYLRAGLAGWQTTPGRGRDDYKDSGQCRDCFQPAFNYRPASSAQYILAIRDFADPANPKRFRMGMMGSSDNHTGRPGTGYKEFGRGEMTEGMGRKEGRNARRLLGGRSAAALDRSVPFDLESSSGGLSLFETERATGYFFTGGLIAAHSAGRSREAIWDAMQRKEVYATSGPRILLWFDLVEPDADSGMGTSVRRSAIPRFRARAVGSFEPKPGCPESTHAALGQRVESLCLGECYHPSDQRRLITRIEVVRIRPQLSPDEPLERLIQDPWRTFACAPDPAGCEVEFEDLDFVSAGRDAVYYVRAIEQPSLAIRGDPLRCERDEAGRCERVDICNAAVPADDDCLRDTEQRAWSSPIFVDYDPTAAAERPARRPKKVPSPSDKPLE